MINLMRITMPRFYFHLRTGDDWIPDEGGIDLTDLSAAKREAEIAAREMIAEAIKAGEEQVPTAFVIADDAGRAVESVSFAAMLPKAMTSRLEWDPSAAGLGPSFQCFR
jgi:hypothetical protein